MSGKKGKQAVPSSITKASTAAIAPAADKTKKDENNKTVTAGKDKEAVKLPPVSPSKKIAPTSNKPAPTEKKAETKLKAAGVSKGGSGTKPNEKKPSNAASQAPANAAETVGDDSQLPQLVKTPSSEAVVSSVVEATAGIQTQDQPTTSTDPVRPTETVSKEAEEAAKKEKEQEEIEAKRKEKGNGMVKLIYEQYDELFPIVDGSTTQANIDEVYCLSFVMPNCKIRLSFHSNPERIARENDGIFDSLVEEKPSGVYQNLEKDQTYYVVVEQEEDQLKRDQEATKAIWQPALKEAQDKSLVEKNDGRGFETCSCIYGNPCVDEYGCKDWHSRFAIATANGWKGF